MLKFFSSIMILLGIVFLMLAKQQWYIEWIQKKMNVSDKKISAIEVNSAIILILLGFLFLVKSIIQ